MRKARGFGRRLVMQAAVACGVLGAGGIAFGGNGTPFRWERVVPQS